MFVNAIPAFILITLFVYLAEQCLAVSPAAQQVAHLAIPSLGLPSMHRPIFANVIMDFILTLWIFARLALNQDA
jgi:hypothetical protein